MCGLVGIAGNLLFQDEFTMKRLLLFDYFRGEHSTGMAAIRTSGDAVVSKLASNPIDLFNMGQFKAALNGSASRAFIGHNRQATRGAVNTANAHPFHVDHIIGAHNGTLTYSSVAALEKELGEKFAVDSLAMITAIARLGIKKTIELCEEGKDSKDGAWALTWFNQQEGTLNFLRNKHRPLFYCFEEGFKRMLWASEWWMLREAMNESTNKYKLYTEDKDDKCIGYFSFDDDVHYKFDLDKLCQGSKKRPKPVCQVLKGKEIKSFTYSGSHCGPLSDWPRGTGTSGTHIGNVGSQKSTPLTTTSHGTNKKSNVIKLEADNKHPYANIIDEEKFSTMVTYGCAWCHAPVSYGTLGVSIFERDGRVLCPSCNGYSVDDVNAPVRLYVRGSIIDQLQ